MLCAVCCVLWVCCVLRAMCRCTACCGVYCVLCTVRVADVSYSTCFPPSLSPPRLLSFFLSFFLRYLVKHIRETPLVSDDGLRVLEWTNKTEYVRHEGREGGVQIAANMDRKHTPIHTKSSLKPTETRTPSNTLEHEIMENRQTRKHENMTILFRRYTETSFRRMRTNVDLWAWLETVLPDAVFPAEEDVRYYIGFI